MEVVVVEDVEANVETSNNSKDKVNVLVFGSGAREHAVCESVSRSPLLNKLYVAKTGVFHLGEVVEFSDYEDLAKKCVNLKIGIAIFSSEEPLCDGVVDIFNKYNVPSIGVNKEFSQLESSKLYGKKFMERYGIKTAKYSIATKQDMPDYDKLKYPIVIKADGLCKGKGVAIANNKAFAEKTINEFFEGKFGENSKTILLEEFLRGEELSLISLWDGKNLLHFATARDFKKLNKSESAPNTGGMGAFCPVKLNAFQQKKLDEYKIKLEKALKNETAGKFSGEAANFVGFIYSGLIMAKESGTRENWDWHVLEFNVRLGDPEAQAILMHLESDFLTVLKSTLEQNLDKVKLQYCEDSSACLVIACEGYPKDLKYQKTGKKISIPERDNMDIKIFNAGVEEIDGELYSKGGRVLSLCTTSQDPFWDLKNFAKTIEMENKYFRTDIEIR